MNFINRYRRNNLQSRRGMILLVVMAVLTFFAVLGMTFILMTGKNRDSAETAQLAAQNSKTAGNSPQDLLEEGIMQVLVGPPSGNSKSALDGCDIIGDMYGYIQPGDNNLDIVSASFSANKMTPASAAYAGRVVTIAEGPYKGQSTLILNSRGAIIPFASGIGGTEAIASCKCVINKNRAFQGDAANYDAADLNGNTSNNFMSLRYTGGSNGIKVGRVVMPSYYRGESKRPGCSSPNELGADVNAIKKYGVNPLTNPIEFAASNQESPWDVDNDGDGDNDSVWMHLGLPPRPMPDGTLVVPMYAILVEDMDGRINVNAHSPDEAITTTAYSSLGTDTTTLANGETLEPTTMLNGQGFGPADINMDALLGSDIASDVVTSRKGANANSTFFKYCFPELTSLKDTPFTLAANNTGVDYRSPLDFYGVMAGAIDQNGMFIWQKRGTVGSYGASSYERDLGSAQPRGNRITNAPSKPFSPEELERVVRAYDDDAKKLESRLFTILKDSANDIDAIRNLVTTESWDMPYCDISAFEQNNSLNSLPEEIQAGFKLDINRPLSSYETNPTAPVEERTQLAKDLYLIAKACVGQSKAAAQWAVNAVDFRDSDSVCTHLNIDGYDVWGCERPELLITETFAFHARMTEDTELGGWRSDDSNKCAQGATAAGGMIDAEWYDKADCPDNPGQAEVEAFCTKYGLTFNPRNMEPIIALMAKVRANNGDGVADMDQVYRPESGLFIELYNPWLSAEKQEATPSAEYSNGGVPLESSGGSMVDSAWRIAVAGGAANGNPGTAWAQDLREMTNPSIDRVLYFGSSTPQSGSFTYKVNSSFCVKPGQFAIIGPAGNTYLARNEDSGAGARPIVITNGSTSVKFDNTTYNNVCAIGVPDCGKARFSVTDIGEYTDPVDNNGKLTAPRDKPYDADNPSRWTGLCNGHGLGEDFEQAGYRIVYLQRLANPYKAYNATTNPYITFDQMPVDLFSYCGRQNKFADYKTLNKGQKASDADELAYKHADVFIKSRQRGETQAFAGSTCANFWTAEKIPGQTNKTASSKLSLSTQGTGRGAVIAAVKTNFYHSINRFEPNFYNLADTTVGTGTTTTAKLPSYQSAAPYYFPNRPFNSVVELMLVPQVSAYELTSSANAIDKPVSAELTTGNLPKYLHPTGDCGNIDFLSESGSKILNFVRIQTPFVVTPMNVNTYYVNGTNQSVSANVAPDGYRWAFREPGKININSITHPAVWEALLGVASETELTSIAGLPSSSMYNDYWGKIFTENHGSRLLTFGDTSGNYILTKVPGAENPIFRMNQATKESQSAAYSVYFQTQLMQRLSNLTTTRSNVFAVWITVGFFEYQNGTVGKEYGLDNGSRQRYRAFYLIDRTRPVGYSPGMRMNADKTIILRRYLP